MEFRFWWRLCVFMTVASLSAWKFRREHDDTKLGDLDASAGLPKASTWRPPAIPLITTDPYMQTWLTSDAATGDVVRHWDQRPKEMAGMIRFDNETFRFLGPNPTGVSALEQQMVQVLPMRTVFSFQDPKRRIELNITFLSTLFTDDYNLLSRPISYVLHEVRSLDGKPRSVDFYFDMTAQHVVNSESEAVVWTDSRMGTQAQNVLGLSGDQTNINWGYLYLQGVGEKVSSWGGSASTARDVFQSNGSLPVLKDEQQPRPCSDSLPALSVVANLDLDASATAKPVRLVVLVGYDDIKSISYYNEGQFPALWTQEWSSIEAALKDAAAETQQMLEKSITHDDDIMNKLSSRGGNDFAKIGALAYRQTLAATKLVWNTKRQTTWNALKEISTNGDMQTMDVIYPASPFFLYTAPDLLKLLLLPVLAFANNETTTVYTQPFSPHEIGSYPIADHNTSQQEPMPMENTGNMFLMLFGLSRQGVDMSFLKPYWPMLTTWADYLQQSLPFPADQLCTDDFTGRLANNTNLAAKGIVALEAFAELCKTMPSKGDESKCEGYRTAARDFAATWKKLGWDGDHSNIAFGHSDTYSIKYNMVWQKSLELDGPFDWEAIVPAEIAYYKTKANKYGVPMDYRHTYVKLDWLSWAAAMAEKESDFESLFEPIYQQAEDTTCRVPLTDLFDTVTAQCAYGQKAFVARPVVGGVYMKMLMKETVKSSTLPPTSTSSSTLTSKSINIISV